MSRLSVDMQLWLLGLFALVLVLVGVGIVLMLMHSWRRLNNRTNVTRKPAAEPMPDPWALSAQRLIVTNPHAHHEDDDRPIDEDLDDTQDDEPPFPSR